jgi:branched-subunit amino acid aminotransferase/4-amino-4-deoxychorismate lyase
VESAESVRHWEFPAVTRYPQFFGRFNRRVFYAAVGLIVLAAFSGSTAQEDKKTESDAATKVHREGTRIEQQPISFRTESDRLWANLGNSAKPILVLENLAAQRIYRANREDPEDCKWTVSGQFTEFEGRNFFLIERAVRLYQKDK